MIAFFLLLQLDPDAARLRAREAQAMAEAKLSQVAGVQSVGMGGGGTEYRLFIVVDGPDSKALARGILGGDLFEGTRIVWTVTGTGLPVSTATDPKKPPPTKSEAASVPGAVEKAVPGNPWNAELEDCDILRDYFKLKKVSHPAGNGRSWSPCAVHLRQVVGAGGGHSFSYAKHRPDCPIQLGRIGLPRNADRFITWLFNSGVSEPIRAGFTYPTELRASDSLWAQQAAADVESRRRSPSSGNPPPPPPADPVPTGQR